MRKIVVFTCLIRLLCLAAAGEPVITEFSASNALTLTIGAF